jgi:hypothetical protein
MAFYLPLSLIAFTAAAAVANAKPQQENPAQPSALEQPPQIQQQQPPVEVAEGFSTNGADVPKCGTKETDFAPCVSF